MTKEDPRLGFNAARIAFLDGLRGFAIVLVVATHAMAYSNLDVSTSSVLSFWVRAVAVPAFFLVDGFLFVRSLQKNPVFNYPDYCVRSAQRLLVPWTCFSLLYLIFRAGFEVAVHPPITVVFGHSVRELAASVYYSSVSAQLYFLPALFLIRILSWCTRLLIMLPPLSALILWLAYVCIWQFANFDAEIDGRIDPLVSSLWGMQYYILGVALAQYEKRFASGAFFLAVLGLTVLATVKIWFPSAVIVAQYAYLGTLFFLFLSFGDKEDVFAWLGRVTMPIYLLHAPVILKVFGYAFVKIFAHSSIARYFAVTICTILTSAFIARLFAKFTWWRFLMGER